MESKKVKNQRKNKRYSLIILLGIFLFFLGISYLVYNHYDNKKQDNIEKEMIEEFFEIEDEEQVVEEEQQEQPIKQEVVNYMAVLEIPKINLKRGLFDKNSSSNNVNRNIYILKETTLPDEQINSHIILAAHSGNSYISFFRNLKKIDMKDKIYFYYKGVKYIYEVSNKYEIEKTGTTELKQTNISDITLITCISGTNKQVVYVATLVGYENY
ncbi:MAG: sortase [Bacilli bacterium]|nr:sortase [Bacilli bacterium]